MLLMYDEEHRNLQIHIMIRKLAHEDLFKLTLTESMRRSWSPRIPLAVYNGKSGMIDMVCTVPTYSKGQHVSSHPIQCVGRRVGGVSGCGARKVSQIMRCDTRGRPIVTYWFTSSTSGGP